MLVRGWCVSPGLVSVSPVLVSVSPVLVIKFSVVFGWCQI